MIIHIPSWLLWMLLGGIVIPVGFYILLGVAELVIAWWIFRNF